MAFSEGIRSYVPIGAKIMWKSGCGCETSNMREATFDFGSPLRGGVFNLAATVIWVLRVHLSRDVVEVHKKKSLDQGKAR